MSKGTKLISYIARNTIFKPYYKMVKEVKQYDKKQYAILISQVDRNIKDEIYERSQPRHYEVYQQFDNIIHEHDFW